jgi:hypothetical protein
MPSSAVLPAAWAPSTQHQFRRHVDVRKRKKYQEE